MSDNKRRTRKIHLPVTKDLNGFFKHSSGRFRIQLAGRRDRGGFWLEQMAKKLGYKDFLKQYMHILSEVEKENEVRKKNMQYPIGIYSLYITDDHTNS